MLKVSQAAYFKIFLGKSIDIEKVNTVTYFNMCSELNECPKPEKFTNLARNHIEYVSVVSSSYFSRRSLIIYLKAFPLPEEGKQFQSTGVKCFILLEKLFTQVKMYNPRYLGQEPPTEDTNVFSDELDLCTPSPDDEDVLPEEVEIS